MTKNSHSLEILALVGARSGSKGIPDKNIRLLAGKPLMAWIIEAAKNSKHVTRIIVSTDSEEYSKIARTFGVETPFIRPKEISGDKSTDYEYIIHALGWLKEHENYEPDIVLRLVPTAPLQKPEDIDAVIEKLMADPETHSAMVVAEAFQHPSKALKIIQEPGGNTRLVNYITGKGRDADPVARQGYEKAYFRANVIASRLDTIKKLNSLSGDCIQYYIIPQERAVDIDSEADFLVAETLLEKMSKK